jgi:predicted nucleotidyltransferase
MEPTFERLLARLTASEVRFLVVGGVAAILNGYVRLTEDIDLLVDAAPGNLEKLISCLAAFGEGHGGGLALEDFTPEPGAIRIIEESEDCQIDLFTEISGWSYAELVDGSETAEIGPVRFRHASKSQLMAIKSGSVREKDQLDVLAMKRLLDDPRAFD